MLWVATRAFAFCRGVARALLGCLLLISLFWP